MSAIRKSSLEDLHRQMRVVREARPAVIFLPSGHGYEREDRQILRHSRRIRVSLYEYRMRTVPDRQKIDIYNVEFDPGSG